jgi:hypothetical protein
MLLHAIMQVPFESPAFRQAGFDDTGPRCANLFQFRPCRLRLELSILQGQPAGLHGGVEQAPVPGQGRVGDDDRDRDARLGTDELDQPVMLRPVQGRAGNGQIENIKRRSRRAARNA